MATVAGGSGGRRKNHHNNPEYTHGLLTEKEEKGLALCDSLTQFLYQSVTREGMKGGRKGLTGEEEEGSRRYKATVNSSCTLAGAAVAVIKAVKVVQGRKQMERRGGNDPRPAARRRKDWEGSRQKEWRI